MTGVVVLVFRILLAVALYGFLGVFLVSLWRQLMDQSRKSAQPKIPPIILEPVDDSKHHLILHDLTWVTIGRDPQCEIHAEDPELSARHALMSYHHRQWWLEDLKSTNGTFLNGRRINEAVVLVSQDLIKCGIREWKVILEQDESVRSS